MSRGDPIWRILPVFITAMRSDMVSASSWSWVTKMKVMHTGKIRQIGSSRDIYDRPAERFVANFIGETNFLEGSLVSSAKGQAKVKLASGAEIMAGLPEGFTPKDKVTIVVRPEHADIVKPGKTATANGKLANVVYFGTDTHYHVDLKDGGPFIVRRQNSRHGGGAMEAGMDVGILFEAGAAQVLRD